MLQTFARAVSVFALAAAVPTARAQTVSVSIRQLADDYSWGYRCAVKQPLGSYSLGRTVYNISRDHDRDGRGSPDYVVWVNEHSGVAEIIDVGLFDPDLENPGGMVDFGDDGSIWFALGARAHELPLDLARTETPYDPHSFSVLLDDFVSDNGSTVPCFRARGDSGLMLYRNGWSSWFGRVTARVQRYDLAGDVPVLLEEFDLGAGSLDEVHGKIGIEQMWLRHDPRVGATAATWQWWQVDERWFGSNPFVLTRDDGQTWELVDGGEIETPVYYSDRSEVMVPLDHVAQGLDAQWHPRDLGWTPGGTPWMTLPDGELNAVFWRWDGAAWEGHTFAGPVIDKAKPYAAGATRDYTVVVYSEAASPGELYAIVSDDDGASWSEPTLIDTVPDRDSVCWVVFVQPSERYLDNAARFIYGYYHGNNRSKNYEDSVRFVRLQIGPRSDFNGDAIVDVRDMIDYLGAWATRDWRADYRDDGDVNTMDFIAFMFAWASRQ